MKRNQKLIVILLLIIAIIIGIIAFFSMNGYFNKDNGEISENHMNDPAKQGEEQKNAEQNVQLENTETVEETKPEVQLLEDEGDLEIIIPEDQDSAGF